MKNKKEKLTKEKLTKEKLTKTKSTKEILVKENTKVHNPKYGLIKYTGILILVVMLLSWIFKINTESGETFYRVGLVDVFFIAIQTIMSFSLFAIFILAIGGLYELLSRNRSYQVIVAKWSNEIKDYGDFFVLATMLFFAILSAVVVDSYMLLVFIPFFVTIILKLKYDKLTAFLATFGGMLVGIIGSVFGSKVYGELSNALALKINDVLVYRIGLFAVTFILLSVFTILHIKNKNKKDDELKSDDPFEFEVESKPKKNWPLGIVLGLFTLLIFLSFIPWATFGMEWPNNLSNWFANIKIFDVAIFQQLVGNVPPFGNGDVFVLTAIIAILSIIIGLMSKISFAEFIDTYGAGFKKMGKTVLVMLAIYMVFLTAYYFPTLEPLFAKIMPSFNYILSAVIVFISSLFGVEMANVLSVGGGAMIETFSGKFAPSTLAVIFQSIYGLVQFVAPSSLFLMIGLSYLDIPYPKWFKVMWKFLLALLVVVIVTIVIITQI